MAPELEAAPGRRRCGRTVLKAGRSAALGVAAGRGEVEDHVGRQPMVRATCGWTQSTD
jgi:hypothetical protein